MYICMVRFYTYLRSTIENGFWNLKNHGKPPCRNIPKLKCIRYLIENSNLVHWKSNKLFNGCDAVDVCILPDIISLHWCHYQVPTNTFNRPSETPKLWCALICQKAFCTKSFQHQRELPNVFAGGDQEWLMRPGRKVPPHLATSRGMKATLPNSFFARPMKKFHRSQQFQFSDFSLPLPIASPSASFSLFVCALVCLCASSFVCVFVSLMRMWIFFYVILHWPFPAIFLFILVLSTTIQNFYTLMWKMSVWRSSS